MKLDSSIAAVVTGGASGLGAATARRLAAHGLMGEGIRVNTILPGIFATPLLAALPEPVLKSLGESVAFSKRLGAPGEYAHLAETMITNGYFNGECVRLNGAIRLAPR